MLNKDKRCRVCGHSLATNKHPLYSHHNGDCHRRYIKAEYLRRKASRSLVPVVCSVCSMPLHQGDKQPGYRHHAEVCHKQYRKDYYNRKKIKRRQKGEHLCRDCKSTGPFYDSQPSYCIPCHLRRSAERYRTKVNPGKRKDPEAFNNPPMTDAAKYALSLVENERKLKND